MRSSGPSAPSIWRKLSAVSEGDGEGSGLATSEPGGHGRVRIAASRARRIEDQAIAQKTAQLVSEVYEVLERSEQRSVPWPGRNQELAQRNRDLEGCSRLVRAFPVQSKSRQSDRLAASYLLERPARGSELATVWQTWASGQSSRSTSEAPSADLQIPVPSSPNAGATLNAT